MIELTRVPLSVQKQACVENRFLLRQDRSERREGDISLKVCDGQLNQLPRSLSVSLEVTLSHVHGNKAINTERAKQS